MPGLEDDTIVKILLFEDSGDEVIPSDSGRCLEDDSGDEVVPSDSG